MAPNWSCKKEKAGSTEIWTRIAGFRVQSANHYTIEPWLYGAKLKLQKGKARFYRDLNSDRWIQSPEC